MKIAMHPEAYQQVINDVSRAAIPHFPTHRSSVSRPTSASSFARLHKRLERRSRSREHLGRMDS